MACADSRLQLLVPNEDSETREPAPLSARMAIRLLRAAKAVRPPPSTGRWFRHDYTIYVALLVDAPKQPGLSFYVGRTHISDRERYRNHKRGWRAGAGHVECCGIGLLPELYSHLKELDWDQVLVVEPSMAEALREAGIHVFQN
jgi:hypothetical protein